MVRVSAYCIVRSASLSALEERYDQREVRHRRVELSHSIMVSFVKDRLVECIRRGGTLLIGPECFLNQTRSRNELVSALFI